MKNFINNVVYMGFWNIVLWFIVIQIIHFFINNGFKGVEEYLGIEEKIYWYDFVWLGIMLFTFIYGIYEYK